MKKTTLQLDSLRSLNVISKKQFKLIKGGSDGDTVITLLDEHGNVIMVWN